VQPLVRNYKGYLTQARQNTYSEFEMEELTLREKVLIANSFTAWSHNSREFVQEHVDLCNKLGIPAMVGEPEDEEYDNYAVITDFADLIEVVNNG
jgi:uncharacterized membrane-anchored protein